MVKGETISTRTIKNALRNKYEEIDIYISEVLKREYLEFDKDNIGILNEYIISFLRELTEEELLEIKSYTGYNYKNINAILRNNWDYEINGRLDENIKRNFLNRSKKVVDIVNKFPNIPLNFKTHRGVNIDTFKKYGIESLEELIYMKDKLVYEEGFSSTSLIKENCYFNKNINNVNDCNILIEYYIPEESKDGALLNNELLSYSPNQTEYILNANCLTKVFDVVISEDKKTAILKAVLIPKNLWNNYEYENNNLKK